MSINDILGAAIFMGAAATSVLAANLIAAGVTARRKVAARLRSAVDAERRPWPSLNWTSF